MKFNPLPTNDCKSRHEIFSFMMSHPAISLGDRFCVSRMGRTGGGGWVHPKGANSMATSVLSCVPIGFHAQNFTELHTGMLSTFVILTTPTC